MRKWMTEDEAFEALCAGNYGVLSLIAPDGTPYGVPLNYSVDPSQRALFFHCARRGRKLDCIRHCPQVSFALVGREELVQERYTTHYDSVIAQGAASVVEERAEKALRLKQLCEALCPDAPDHSEMVRRWVDTVAIVRVDIGRLTGKRNLPDSAD